MGHMNVRNLNMKQYREEILQRMNVRLKALAAGDFETNLPLFIWGWPGVGKSMIISSVAKESWTHAKDDKGKSLYSEALLNEKRPWDGSMWNTYDEKVMTEWEKNLQGFIVMDVRLSQVNPVEIKGAPFYDVANMKAGFIRFASILPDPKCKWPVFLLLDEFPLAPDMVQSAGYQLINERKVGDYRLPEKCVVFAAGNPPECPGAHFEMSLPLENRFDHINLDIDYEGFVKYMSLGKHKYDPTVVAFLQYSKEQDKQCLYNVEKQMGKGNFPTFRSWEKGARKILYGYPEYNALADSVGQAVASKYEVFRELTKDIPAPDVLVNKHMYYAEIQLQLVASQKVGNLVLQKDTMDKMTDERAFQVFQYFVDMRKPGDKTDNREELTILFLVNVRDEMEVLDKIDKGFQKALKGGKVKVEKNEAGEEIRDIYGLIFHKWASLKDID